MSFNVCVSSCSMLIPYSYCFLQHVTMCLFGVFVVVVLLLLLLFLWYLFQLELHCLS